MRWTPGGVSEDIEDERGEGGGGGGGFGFGGPHLGIGGTIVLLILSFVFRQNFFSLFNASPVQPGRPIARESRPTDTRETQFMSFVLDDVQKTWDAQLQEQTQRPYRHAKLVLFENYTRSGCGGAQSSTGPFYCPADEKVYLDLSFFDELRRRFGAPGEFAQAYVIAHEIGHHVQKILGIEAAVHRRQLQDPDSANRLSVGLELQADCLAGVWGHSTQERKIIDDADVADGLRAAASVGDDRLQRQARGYVTPESFTHGSSEQRTAAFKRGLEAGTVEACTARR